MVGYEIVVVGALLGAGSLYILGTLGLLKRMNETDHDEPNVPRKPNERGITYLVRSALYISYHGIIFAILILIGLAGIVYKVLSWLFGKPEGGSSE